MSNQITASVIFSFRGMTHNPSLRIDLDALMRAQGEPGGLHVMLAKANGIDLYSYEFELMEDLPITFSAATGMATDYLDGTDFDLAGFRLAWRKQQALDVLRPLALEYLHIADLSTEPALRDALLAAYRAGQRTPE